VWVDFDYVVVDELDVEEVFDVEVLDDRIIDVHQFWVVECHEVYCKFGVYCFVCFWMSEYDLIVVCDFVDCYFVVCCEFYYE